MGRRANRLNLSTPLPFRYVLFHKPFQVMCQFTPGSTPPADGSARPTLANYVPLRGIYPVGRLDYDSEGLLLLTDDGPLQHRLADPKFEHPRTYWAQVEGTVTSSALERLRLGVPIQGYMARARQAELIPEPVIPERVPPIRHRLRIPTSWIQLTLTEGRNRQVRRMTAAAGFPTLRLIRVALGPLTLDGLPPGSWRELQSHELQSLHGLARAAGSRLS